MIDGPLRNSELDEFLEQGERIRALAQQVIPDACLYEDVAQELWMQGLDSQGRSQPSDSAWLRVVLRNLFRRTRRSERRRARRERVVARRESVQMPPGKLLEHEELRRAIRSAVHGLPEPHRSTILLRYFEGRKTEDIATRHGVSIATVRSRLSRARATLRERLEGTDRAVLAAPSIAFLKPSPSGTTMATKLLGSSSAVPLGGTLIMSGKVICTVAACTVIGGLMGWGLHGSAKTEEMPANSLAADSRVTALEHELERARAELGELTERLTESSLKTERLRARVDELTQAAVVARGAQQDPDPPESGEAVGGGLDWTVVTRAFLDVAEIVQKDYKERTPLEAAKITELFGKMATLSATAKSLHSRPFLEPGFLSDLASSMFRGTLALDEQQLTELAERTAILEDGLPVDGEELTPLDRLALRDRIIDDLHRGIEDLLDEEQLAAWPKVGEFSDRFLRFGDQCRFGTEHSADHFLTSWLSNALDAKGNEASQAKQALIPAAVRFQDAARDALSRFGVTDRASHENLEPEQQSALESEMLRLQVDYENEILTLLPEDLLDRYLQRPPMRIEFGPGNFTSVSKGQSYF